MQFNLKRIYTVPSFRHILAIVIICCIGTAIYSNTFNSSFHLDDFESIVNHLSIRSLSYLKELWDFTPTRIVSYLSLVLNYYFNKLDVFGYHLFNLSVHLVSAVFVWWLTLLTLSTPALKSERISQHACLIAFFSGLVFLTHPIQTESITYIIQRVTSLATLLYLASLTLYVKSRLLTESAVDSSKGNIYYLFSLIVAFLAMFTKEITITLPLAVLLYEFYFFNIKKEHLRKCFAFLMLTLPVIPFVLLTTRYLKLSGIKMMAPAISDIPAWHYLVTQVRVIITYIGLLFVPVNQNLDYDYPIFEGLFEPPVLISLFALIIIVILVVRLFRRYKLISFGIVWFFLTLLPESSVIPIKDVIFEHRLYLPIAGFSIFLVSGLYYIIGIKNIKRMCLVLIIIVASYSIMTYSRNFIWRDDLTLWTDVIKKSPRKPRAYCNRGIAYAESGEFDRAISDFTKAIEIKSGYPFAYYNRGFSYQKIGELEMAISDYTEAIEGKSDYARAYNNRGIAYAMKGEFDKAISDFSKAIGIEPNYAEAYKNRANAYFLRGDNGKGREDMYKAESLGYKIDHGAINSETD